MTEFIGGFLVGGMLGAGLGILVMAMVFLAKECDDQEPSP